MKMLSFKQITFFCGLTYLFLLIFAFHFFFERLNSDAGYYFFHAVNTQWFHVEHGRFVLILAELLPVLGSNAHLPLKTVAILYSLNHVLFFAILVTICLYKFKNYNSAVLIVMMQFIGIKYSVLTPQFELYYGLGLLIFTFANYQFYLQKSTSLSSTQIIKLGLLLILVFTSHPMAIFCTFVGLAIFFLNQSNKNIWLLSFILLFAYVAWKKWAVSDYEKSKFDGFKNALEFRLNGFFNFEFIRKSIKFLITYYWDCFIIFAFGIYQFIKGKTYLKAIVYLVSIKMALLVIWIMFPPETMGRYIEQVYFPFVFLVCIWLFEYPINRIFLLGVVLLIVIRAGGIWETGNAFQKRTQQMARFVEIAQKSPGSKFFITEKDMGNEMYEKGNWSYGFESLIYSSIHSKKNVSITKDEDLYYKQNHLKLKPTDFLFRPFEIIPTKSLNQHYFKIEDGHYSPLINP